MLHGQLPSKHHQQEIHVLVRIFHNILQHPNEGKYKDLNLKRVFNRLNYCQICIDLLQHAGFIVSDNGERLLFDPRNMTTLRNCHMVLSTSPQYKSNHVTQFNCNVDNPSQRFLSRSKAYSNHGHGDVQCALDDCLCLEIMCDVMRLYHVYITSNVGRHKTQSHIDDSVYSEIGNGYNNVDLLDDFNHLLSCHSHEFEDVYNMLKATVYDGEDCNLSQCVMMKRNHRDRSAITKNESILYQLYFDKDNIVAEQLLDRVHCYYFHTFDVGRGLTENDRCHILGHAFDETQNYDGDPLLSAFSDIIASKQQQQRVFQRNQHTNHKFVTDIDEKECDEENEYFYGYRFFYWSYYKNNNCALDPMCTYTIYRTMTMETTSGLANPDYKLCDWFIYKKYCNLKEELLNNDICCVGEQQWDQLLLKASTHINSVVARNIFCMLNVSERIYALKHMDSMMPNHFIAVMTYCNYNALQLAFAATFRKQNSNETDDELKSRHSRYYHLGRYLRECIECFGLQCTIYRGTKGNQLLFLYRGISQSFMFSSMETTIQCPFSTTTDVWVAHGFSENGMVLELSVPLQGYKFTNDGDSSPWLAYGFDCQWWSDYVNEKEILCIGGALTLQFESIIDVRYCVNYQHYIKAIKHLTFGMSTKVIRLAHAIIDEPHDEGHAYVPSNRNEKQLLSRLISHELHRYRPENSNEFKECPDYISKILHLHCRNVKTIHIYSIEGIHQLAIDFFKDKHGFIQLDLLTTVFPSLRSLNCDVADKNVHFILGLLNTIYEYVKNGGTTLIYIRIAQIHIRWQLDIETFINSQKWKYVLSTHGWEFDTCLTSNYDKVNLVRRLGAAERMTDSFMIFISNMSGHPQGYLEQICFCQSCVLENQGFDPHVSLFNLLHTVLGWDI
eukprot:230988_1